MNPWHPVVDVVVKLIEKLAGFLSAFFMGRGYERNKNIKQELKDAEKRAADVGVSDSDLAERLRERARKKRKDRN